MSDAQTEAQKFDTFLAKLTTFDVEKLTKLFIQSRDASAASTRLYDAEQAKFKKIRETCENLLLKKADDSGTSGFKCEGVGTSFVAEDVKISIADAGQFTQFLESLPANEDKFGFYEQRVSSRRVQDYIKANGGTAPPGLNIFRQRVMRIRKASEKGEK